jgi:hypothetical protein
MCTKWTVEGDDALAQAGLRKIAERKIACTKNIIFFVVCVNLLSFYVPTSKVFIGFLNTIK